MPSFSEVVRTHTRLTGADVVWLQLLQADWQIIADLSFADLVLWLPDRDGSGFWAAAQMRPTTGPTAYVDDVVGIFAPTDEHSLLGRAWSSGRVVREGDPEWRDEVPVRTEAIPVVRAGAVIGVIERQTNLLGVRTPSRLELTYLQTAGDLTQMIAAGDFPATAQRSDHADSPRVGDGFLRVDSAGHVVYASPNAQSVYRRLGLSGDLTGLSLPDLVRDLVPARRRPDEETLSAVLGGRAHRDVEIGGDEVSLIVRSVPLRTDGEHIGALILVRDVTDLRRRDRELVTKDATIREIHHRVKNNLQTVAALLRLQARRIGSDEAKAALEEAVRRVGSIAIVHETLSLAVEETVEFDEIADRLGGMVTDVSALTGRVHVRRDGSFGAMSSEAANALAMVLTELMQNAVEHGFSTLAIDDVGAITVTVRELVGRLHVTVSDDGAGLPEDFSLDGSTNLGLSIVRTLVESELGGQLELTSPGVDRGTRAEIDIPAPSTMP
ncbi:sensor histidine kinase [Nocardioides sp. R-C-SC26]|uniref:sensor histidine kinase n=1 Tax=Nocardioides sp. R-C-SC26 TaxID=2870414 RepID=UPI001E35AB35|nr:PAS domain-containing sensor histidine kinase [Nocardioides sp. R-C-SC26]